MILPTDHSGEHRRLSARLLNLLTQIFGPSPSQSGTSGSDGQVADKGQSKYGGADQNGDDDDGQEPNPATSPSHDKPMQGGSSPSSPSIPSKSGNPRADTDGDAGSTTKSNSSSTNTTNTTNSSSPSSGGGNGPYFTPTDPNNSTHTSGSTNNGTNSTTGSGDSQQGQQGQLGQQGGQGTDKNNSTSTPLPTPTTTNNATTGTNVTNSTTPTHTSSGNAPQTTPMPLPAGKNDTEPTKTTVYLTQTNPAGGQMTKTIVDVMPQATSTSSPSSSHADHPHLPLGPVIGGAAGGLVALVLLIWLISIPLRRHKKQKDVDDIHWQAFPVQHHTRHGVGEGEDEDDDDRPMNSAAVVLGHAAFNNEGSQTSQDESKQHQHQRQDPDGSRDYEMREVPGQTGNNSLGSPYGMTSYYPYSNLDGGYNADHAAWHQHQNTGQGYGVGSWSSQDQQYQTQQADYSARSHNSHGSYHMQSPPPWLSGDSPPLHSTSPAAPAYSPPGPTALQGRPSLKQHLTPPQATPSPSSVLGVGSVRGRDPNSSLAASSPDALAPISTSVGRAGSNKGLTSNSSQKSLAASATSTSSPTSPLNYAAAAAALIPPPPPLAVAGMIGPSPHPSPGGVTNTTSSHSSKPPSLKSSPSMGAVAVSTGVDGQGFNRGAPYYSQGEARSGVTRQRTRSDGEHTPVRNDQQQLNPSPSPGTGLAYSHDDEIMLTSPQQHAEPIVGPRPARELAPTHGPIDYFSSKSQTPTQAQPRPLPLHPHLRSSSSSLARNRAQPQGNDQAYDTGYDQGQGQRESVMPLQQEKLGKLRITNALPESPGM
ncbi:hypothetical protein BDZ90DRAFT_194046 [Jaminaea rosea]|uniref:Uncharacterized protein n=1 Tax=Jaminaea rosea TaxID=1569628 RepID=A0A316URD6_9BASI|nr:hypothetical protein BDZ90DRAFT_194046 [Jaminaea rosea]PWN26881.1 hypothetical protein BDZ90DRAFT_194046 [Jaminaea rosea]